VQKDVLWVANTNLVRVRKLQNQLTGVYINDATVTATLIDDAGVNVAGGSWPQAMAYEAGTDGAYVASLPSALALTNGQAVILRVSAIQGSLTARWDIPMIALTRATDQ
tara:strand:+ start:394 stop:720 length:327 start_codon:yes stop_codon:yes gene_type:complete